MKKVVLITGGSDGLGKEIAKVLKDNYQVVIVSSNLERLKKTAEKLGVAYFLCNIVDFNQCEETVKKIINKFGKIDVLINNAGVWIEGALENNNDFQIKKTIEINLIGQIFMTKSVLPLMKKNKAGTIIFINSRAGLKTKGKRTVYNATKWGLRGFAESLEEEIANDKIKVISFYPGKMRTSFFEKAGVKKDLRDAFNPFYLAKLIKSILDLPNKIIVFQAGMKEIND
ncbi:MAG: SDR family oxidoreductase [Patescibacteria group bacterium]|nr:SDR family oxidoreductase [Patescibacteria group bacterium]